MKRNKFARAAISHVVLVALFVSLMVSLGPTASGGTRKPDLVASVVGELPPRVVHGDMLSLTDTTKNVGKATAASSRTGFYLSKDAKKSTSDVAMPIKRRVAKLKPGASSSGSVDLKVPTKVKPATYRVLACADVTKAVRESNEANNCKASATAVEVAKPPSVTLIDRALEAGQIDEETALMYEVFAGFADPRLPERFDGDDSHVHESLAIAEAVARWDTLSPQTQAALGPYAVPPFHEGSWASSATTSPGAARAAGPPGCLESSVPRFEEWDFVDSANDKVRIWWQKRFPGDQIFAEVIRDSINDTIWPSLTQLMDREPLPDGGSSVTTLCRGGSDHYDIALVDRAKNSTIGYFGGCQQRPAFTLINRQIDGHYRLPVVAHELMHAIQYAFPLKNGECTMTAYKWLADATAHWAQDHVQVPAANTEQLDGAPESLLHNPEVPLESMTPYPHAYGAYLFPFFASRKYNADVVRQLWVNAQNHGPVDVVKETFGTSWASVWKEFVLYNWNRGSVDYYKDWDGLDVSAAPAAEIELKKGVTDLGIEVDHLAAQYAVLKPNANLAEVSFINPLAGQEGAGFRAILVRKDGSEVVRDWSDKAVIDLCLMDPRIEKIVLIYSNSNTSGTLDFGVESDAKGGCECSEGFTAEPRVDRVAQGEVCEGLIQGTSSGTTTNPGGPVTKWNASYVLEATDQGSGFVEYTVKTGSVSWSFGGTWGECSLATRSGTFQMQLDDAGFGLSDTDSDGDFDEYSHVVTVIREVDTTVTCPYDDEPIPIRLGTEILGESYGDWNGTFPITGSRTYNHGSEVSWQWDLDR